MRSKLAWLPTKTITLACLALALLCSRGIAGIVITQPAGLNPGDQYRLVFVTSSASGGISAVSDNIDTYNTKASAVANSVQALADLGVAWTAIASTPTVEARDNTSTNPNLGVGVPIYLLNGTQFALNYSDLWDAAKKARDLNITEKADPSGRLSVWTGTGFDGTTAGNQVLGGSSGHPLRGNSQISSGSFATGPWGGGWVFDDSLESWQTLSLYAISGILTVPSTGVVPEAASAVIWLVIGLATTTLGNRRRASC